MRISWKHGFADQSLAWDPEAKNTIEYKKHKKHNALGVHSPRNYTMAEINDFFSKKKNKIRARIITPHTRLYVETYANIL